MKLVLLAAVLALAPALRAEDQAIVVGVAGYPGLGPTWKLRGTLADATAMADALAKYKFKVTPILDDKATEKGILDALAAVATKVGPNDRFVFYFAGHGRNKPFPGIGCFDAKPNGNQWINADKLNEAVKAITCSSRTVILDACFSGGMIKDVSGTVSARYYQPPGLTKSAGYDDDDAPEANFPGKKLASSDVCYVAAAGPGQIAQEAVAPPGNPANERRGVFSYFLANQLNGQNLSWGAAVESVREQMVQNEVKLKLLQPQTPVVSNPFAAQPIFAPATAKPTKPTVPTSLLKLLAGERPGAATLSMKAASDKVAMVGEPLRVDVTVGEEGYLVVLEQKGAKFQRVYPPDAEEADELKVGPNSPAPFFTVMSDKAGGVVLKALLLQDKAAAQTLLDTMPPGREIGGNDDAVTKAAFASVSGYTTAYTNLRIGDELLAGLTVKDATKLWATFRGTDALGGQLRDAVQRFNPRVLEEAKTAPAEDGVALKTVVNLILSDRTLAANLAAGGVPLGDLAPLAKQKDQPGAVARNSKLLVALLGGAVAPGAQK